MGSDSKVSIRWEPPAYDGGSAITGYELQVDQGAGETLHAGPESREIIADGLTNGKQYCFQLCAKNAKGVSDAPDMLWATPGEAASPPQFEWAAVPTFQAEGQGILLVFLRRPMHLGGLPVDRYEVDVYEYDASTAAPDRLSERGLTFLDMGSSLTAESTGVFPGCGKKVGTFNGDDSPVVCRGLEDSKTYVVKAAAVNVFGRSKYSRVSSPIKIFVRHFDGEKWSALVDEEGNPNSVISYEMIAEPSLDSSTGSMHPLEESFDLLDVARKLQGERSRALLKKASGRLAGLAKKGKKEEPKMSAGKRRFQKWAHRVIALAQIERVKKQLKEIGYSGPYLGV